MVPLIKRSTEALAEQFGEKAKNGESFNVLKYVFQKENSKMIRSSMQSEEKQEFK